MTVHEALEMSGYQYDRTHATAHKKIAVYFGQTSDDYREVNASQNVDTFWVTAGNRMFANGRVSYHYGWEGQSMNVDGACSSSHLAIQLACSALVSRECDTAVAGGGMVITNPDVYAGLDRGGFLSHTGSCKPLDSQADGYCRAEAVGTLIRRRHIRSRQYSGSHQEYQYQSFSRSSFYHTSARRDPGEANAESTPRCGLNTRRYQLY
jgi:naphtho-gamma-pyrone polyketide synthase